MKPTLSIIIPCYNCAGTLEESVRSIDTQGFDFAYEVIMVDDGSTDDTASVMARLAAADPHIKIMSHSVNRGGGAARNTGIQSSSGQFIYCLDADNILAPATLSRMTTLARDKSLDGVAFEERRFFHGSDHSLYKTHRNTMTDRPIIFEDIWNGSGMILDNFVYSRSSYDRSGGYPEHHGFDTQVYEIRYLGRGSNVHVCPGSIFYHRQNMGQKSYFERVYESGRFSLNYYLGCEDVIYLFSAHTIEALMRFDVFGKASVSGDNFKSFMDKLYIADPKSFFSPHISEYEETGMDGYLEASEKSSQAGDLFCQGVCYFKQAVYPEAVRCWDELIKGGNDSAIVRFNRERARLGAVGVAPDAIEDRAQKTSPMFQIKAQQPLFEKRSLLKRIRNVLKRTFSLHA